MRLICAGNFTRCTVVILGLALAVPLLNGCSQLGIAKADELAATESRLEQSNNATNGRIDTLEKNTNDMQQSLNEIAASIDTLNARFERAKVWLETMNIDTISEDVQEASKAAMTASAQSKSFFTFYLAWIRTQHAELGKQITTLEKEFKQEGSKPEEKSPSDSGEGGGG
jgi:outer membrane murein-binding lipoprotein Lpp